ncbi:MAG: tRNA dimethylallyltransferase, partial [Ignavibacteriales bacterium]
YKFNGEILSADSRQVYRGMDIGTGKDKSEYFISNQQIRYHLIDIADPSEEYNLFRFKNDFIEAYKEIISRGKIPVMVGGTGMYLSSIIQDYKLIEGNPSLHDDLDKLPPEKLKDILINKKIMHNTTDLVSKDRIIKAIVAGSGENALSFKVCSCVIGVHYERDEIKKRITARLKQRLESGMIEEVKNLIAKGITIERLISLGLEYKFVALYLDGKLNYDDMFRKLNSSIHAFAKRQMTWYRKMEREGVKINWIEKGDFSKAEQIVKKFLEDEI